jgi:hypothetical protein
MTQDEVRSLFTLAGIEVTRFWKLPNGYQGDLQALAESVELPSTYNDTETLLTYPALQFLSAAVRAMRNPWWLVKTPAGMIEIGWRKRVISIDWTDTNVRTTITSDDVTKSTTMVHAWSIEKALEYLKALRAAMKANEPTI